MRILAIETSTLNGSIALGDGPNTIHEKNLPSDQRTARTLLPTIQQALVEVNWQPDSIQLLGVTTGPGSFTGLRVGVTAAKTLAYALKIDVIAVNTLELIATQASQAHSDFAGQFAAVIDAQRRQLYYATFKKNEASALRCVGKVRIVSEQQLEEELNSNMILAGPPLENSDRFETSPPWQPADPSSWHPRAATICGLAHDKLQDGQRDDFWTLVPQYYRQSAAEEVKGKN